MTALGVRPTPVPETGPIPAWRRLCAVFLAMVAPMLAGCGTVGLGDGPRDELERNRTVWERFEPARYTYSIHRLCFCGFEARGPVRVVVENGAVVERIYVDTGGPVPAQFVDLFPGVDGLFDLLEDAYERDAFEVEVTYDPDTGVPIDFHIDYQQNVADEEVGYDVTEQVRTTPLP